MKNTLSVLIGASTVVMLTCIVAAIGLAASDSQSDSTLIIATRHAQHRFTIEIARTPYEMERGLMFRDRLPPDHGMLFLYEDDRRVSFWMKNTLIPLDMIWLDGEGRIVWIAHSVPPCKADPCPTFDHEGEALYVVEVVSGFAKQHKLKVGDTLVLRGVKK